MVANLNHDIPPKQVADKIVDGVVTIACWGYFTLGFIVLFGYRYLWAYLHRGDRERRFQRLNSLFYKGFFVVLRALAPRCRWLVSPEAAAVRSSVLVCNHLSYLDPLLFISLFERQKTVVKTVFFAVPIFGWVLRHAGYFPADGSGRYARIMIEQVERMGSFLGDGGNFFIFPEGTRSRDGSIGRLNQGALKIAKLCRAPIAVLRLTNTNRLFTPGKFFFNTRRETLIGLSLVDRLDSGEVQRLSLDELERRIRGALTVPAERCRHRDGSDVRMTDREEA